MDDKSLSEPIKNKQMKSQVCSQNSPLGAEWLEGEGVSNGAFSSCLCVLVLLKK